MKLESVDRNTIFVFESRFSLKVLAETVLLAVARGIASSYPADRVVTLTDVLMLSTPWCTDSVTVVPNTTRHPLVFQRLNPASADFGALDDCVSPHCLRCRRSAQCLSTGICHAISWCTHPQMREGLSEVRTGDRFNTLALTTSGTPTVLRSTRGQGLQHFDYEIWAAQDADGKPAVEFVRTE